jgi:hypothetical protein
VLAKSDTGNIALQEIQLYFDPSILQRNLLGASYSYIGGARKGSTTAEMADEMAEVSAINIFGHNKNCRKDNKELLQPIHFVYDKSPRDIALKEFAVFNIQLPYFPEAPEDYANALYCWCKLLYEMHFNKKLPKEVFDMEPRIREFTERNAGASQFISRYGEVTASPAVQQAYQDWVLADMREASIMRGAKMEGFEEGVEKGIEKGIGIGMEKGIEKGIDIGIEKGKEKGIEKVARNMLDKGWSVEMVMEGTGLAQEQVESLR